MRLGSSPRCINPTEALTPNQINPKMIGGRYRRQLDVVVGLGVGVLVSELVTGVGRGSGAPSCRLVKTFGVWYARAVASVVGAVASMGGTVASDAVVSPSLYAAVPRR